MADLEVRCPKCGKEATVSEFAFARGLSCRACGETLPRPPSAPSTQGKRSFRMGQTWAQHSPSSSAKDETQAAPSPEWRFNTQMRDMRDQPDRKRKINPALLPWLLFATLACAMYFIQRHAIPALEAEDIRATAAPIVYLVFHILITLKAFKDSVFHGVLCFLLPPYALYYMFLASDDFYLRAVFGASLLVIGQDTFWFAQDAWMNCYNAASHFIQGGALR